MKLTFYSNLVREKEGERERGREGERERGREGGREGREGGRRRGVLVTCICMLGTCFAVFDSENITI